MQIKKRIEKLEKERPEVVLQPSRTLPRELTAEEFEALYAETMAAEKLRQESRSNGSR